MPLPFCTSVSRLRVNQFQKLIVHGCVKQGQPSGDSVHTDYVFKCHVYFPYNNSLPPSVPSVRISFFYQLKTEKKNCFYSVFDCGFF